MSSNSTSSANMFNLDTMRFKAQISKIISNDASKPRITNQDVQFTLPRLYTFGPRFCSLQTPKYVFPRHYPPFLTYMPATFF